MVTRVPPSLVPPEGRREAIVGWPDSVEPYEKQLGSDSTTGWGWLVPSDSVICASSCGAENSGKPGVWTTTWFAETDWTMPSRVVPLTVNWARVVDGDPKKRPPLRVRVVPP